MPFVKCGQAIGCVSEDFGKTKALVSDEADERLITSTNLVEREGALWHETDEQAR